MDIMQIKSFWAVVNTGSFTEAGEILHISQSAISKKISSLEQDLGVNLLDRNGKHFTISPVGRAMIKYFIEIIESFDQAMMTLDDIKRNSKKETQRLRVVGVPVLARYGIISLLNKFSKQHLGYELTIDEMEEDRVLLVLQAGDCDIAFCSDLKLDLGHYNIQKAYSEEFMVALSANSELASHKSIRLKDIKEKRLILNRRESMLYEICVNACLEAGFTPNIAMTTSRPSIALEHIRYNDDCVYMGLRNTLENETTEMSRSLPIEDTPRFNFVFAWKKGERMSIPAKQFLKFALDAASIN